MEDLTKGAFAPNIELEKAFERGNIKRAKRDVFARGIEKKGNVDNPYAVATSMVRKGAKPKTKKAKREVRKEFKTQKAAKGRDSTKNN